MFSLSVFSLSVFSLSVQTSTIRLRLNNMSTKLDCIFLRDCDENDERLFLVWSEDETMFLNTKKASV